MRLKVNARKVLVRSVGWVSGIAYNCVTECMCINGASALQIARASHKCQYVIVSWSKYVILSMY